MARKDERTAGGTPDLFGTLAGKLLGILGAGGQIVAGLRDAAERRADEFAARTGQRVLLQLWVSAGIFLGLLGLFELLIDSAEIPRGLVYLVGGALIASVSLLLAHFARKGGAGRSR